MSPDVSQEYSATIVIVEEENKQGSGTKHA
jgi:hypothetical protein